MRVMNLYVAWEILEVVKEKEGPAISHHMQASTLSSLSFLIALSVSPLSSFFDNLLFIRVFKLIYFIVFDAFR